MAYQETHNNPKQVKKLSYKGRAPVKCVQFKNGLPFGGGVGYLNKDQDKKIIQMTVDYTRRELLIRHQVWGSVRVPTENILYYISEPFRSNTLEEQRKVVADPDDE